MDFSQKLLATTAHPTSDVSARETGGKERVEREGETRAKGRGRREGGRGHGREGRQPVAHDHQITSSYSASLVSVHRWSRVRRGSSISWISFSGFLFMCFLLSCPGTESGSQWVCRFVFNIILQTWSSFAQWDNTSLVMSHYTLRVCHMRSSVLFSPGTSWLTLFNLIFSLCWY